MTEGQEYTLDFFAKILLFVWVILLIPWVVMAPLSGMAFDGGNTIGAWSAVVSIWSYGPLVFAAFKLLGRSRKAVLLPFLSIAAIVLPGFVAFLFK
jgi:hypothetical protein